MRQKLLFLVLVGALCLGMVIPAFAAEQQTEIETAGAFLREHGVYQGDSSGNLMLEKGLTRAEMSAILTRLHGGGEINPDHYSWACYFTDVPAWAKPYVGYCVANLLVSGYDTARFGPNDMVTPAMACTVVLRCCGYKDGEGSTWSYGTASQYAVTLGLISQSTTQEPIITRGEMAVLISRTWKQDGTVPAKPTPAPQPEDSSTPQLYTISTDHWSREDFSQEANPEVFTSVYDRALYNTIRQTLVDGTSDKPAYTMVNKEDYGAVKNLLGRLDGLYWYKHYVPSTLTNYWQYLDYFAVSATLPDEYQAILDFIQPAIEKTGRMETDREKVEYLNDYLRALLEYDPNATAAITEVFAPRSSGLKGSCGTYASAFNLLCQASSIPCFTVRTQNHSWNLVYADGAWGHVDVSSNDNAGRNGILLTRELPSRADLTPEATAFLKELLAPGSTK